MTVNKYHLTQTALAQLRAHAARVRQRLQEKREERDMQALVQKMRAESRLIIR